MEYIRTIWQKIEKELSKKEIVVITGPRRVGKTTTLKHLLSKINGKNKLFLDLENIIDRKIFERENYNDVIADLKTRGLNFNEKVYLALDEIQYVKNIPSVIKYLYDHYGIKFILTGSSSYYLKNYFTESLSGRKVLFELLPLSFSEFLLFKQSAAALPDVKIYNPPVKINSALYDLIGDYYKEYVDFGGFPDVAMANSAEEKKQILGDIYSSYINQDVKNLSDFKQISDLRKLVSLLAVRVGNRINTSELSSITGLSRQTVENYIEFLEQTYLIRTLLAESNSQDVKIRKSRKLYFIDTGIASINADLSGGQKFENTVAAQLSHYGQRIGYYENKDGEIDFILRSPIGEKTSKSAAIEAKETPVAADLTALERRSARLNIKNFYIVGRFPTEKFSEYRWGGEL
ncbi:MAG: ATP-binding protein [Endomicrobia bacterium]|nr:ATP-binding protein [Endomicrobiia bacterium]